MGSVIPAAPVQNQISDLPKATVAITTHDPSTKNAVFHNPPPHLTKWHEPIDNNQLSFYTLYHTKKVPGDHSKDLDDHIETIAATNASPGIVIPNGTISRLVDFAPGYSTPDHRSRSLDYGIVVEGTIELILDSGETMLMERGGMVVQRGTMHRWRNPSTTSWARMFFVLVSADAPVIDGCELKEDHGGL